MTAVASRPDEKTQDLDDELRRDGSDRYGVYVVVLGGLPRPEVKRLAATSLTGIGLCLETLRDEGQIADDDSAGILDRETRRWLINPFGAGRR